MLDYTKKQLTKKTKALLIEQQLEAIQINYALKLKIENLEHNTEKLQKTLDLLRDVLQTQSVKSREKLLSISCVAKAFSIAKYDDLHEPVQHPYDEWHNKGSVSGVAMVSGSVQPKEGDDVIRLLRHIIDLSQ